MSDGHGRLEDLTSAEIRRARVAGVHPVPTLADLAEAFPDVTFNIDIKTEGATAALATFVQSHRIADRVMVGSFSSGRLRTFRRLTHGEVGTSAYPGEVAPFVLCPAPLLARALQVLPCVALQVPVRTEHKGRQVEVVTQRFVRNAHAAGKQVHVWTIDDPVEMNRLIDLGVDGLMTDRTDLLKGVLLERGLWPGNS